MYNFEEKWVDYWTTLNELDLTEYFNEDELCKSLTSAPAAIQAESGLAYEGALLEHILLSMRIAERLSKLVSGTFTINIKSLKLVCCLMHLSKIEMFVPNDNEWEVSKRGLKYKFSTLEGCLKAGERSALNALNKGIQLTPIEFEAMKALDKSSDEFESSKYFSNIMTIIIKQANDLAYLIAKEKYGK